MGRSPPSESTLSNKQRCVKEKWGGHHRRNQRNQRCRNDGKLWRCRSWRMEGKSLCNRHFLKQQEYQQKKKNMPPQHHHQPKKRKTRLDNTAKKKKKVKSEKEEDSEDDDSLEKLFEGYPSEKEDDDSIEKLFEDDWTTESDGDSCQPSSKASAMSTCAQEEPVEELKKNQEETPAQSAR